MMTPTKNSDGTLTVPAAFTDGDTTGDGSIRIEPDHPMFQSWLDWIESTQGRV